MPFSTGNVLGADTQRGISKWKTVILRAINRSIEPVAILEVKRLEKIDFYVHNDKRKTSPDPEIKKYIEKAREIFGVYVDPMVGHL
ncbi:hypothetical protein L6452_37105 [Arctium lappa]|uniref:Uncharacterized protein n=1 Tax=Arctium lappa TaxID=4217 RepID=A0ACB8Y339_ARCLA|nr:hypothetical protein L6452_37105 [Arctium lappa]